jgi:carbon storage regulator
MVGVAMRVGKMYRTQRLILHSWRRIGKERRPSKRSEEGSDMLVLSRKLGEKICIGENICITVVDIDRGKIRLGIEAPREVPVFRQELLPLKGGSANSSEAAALSQ